jgi:hypothetical protein
MSGLDPAQFLQIAVRPALAIMGPKYSTTAAEQLVMGTAAVESGFMWLKQHGTGPALGLFQMEPFTYNDLLHRMPDELRFVMHVLAGDANPEPHFVAWNLRFGAAMCRLKYRDDKQPLPMPFAVGEMARTWKRCYNSVLGAGKPSDFERAWDRLIQPQAERMWP